MYDSMYDKNTLDGFTVEFHYDMDGGAHDPRDNCNVSRLALFHRRYDLPNDSDHDIDDFDSPDDFIAALEADGALVITPVYMLEHGNVALRTSDFGDPWDSGQLGVAWTTREAFAECCGDWEGTDADVEMARAAIKGEVEEYGRFLNGEVYGYIVKDPQGEMVDSCWGFIGSEYVEEEGNAALKAEVEYFHKAEEVRIRQLHAEIDHWASLG